MVEMLGRRGENCTSMATSLVKQLENKMKASSLSTSEILQLSQHLEESGLPDGCKDDLLSQCDSLVLQDNHQSAVQLTLKAQTCDYLTNYMTAGDWNSLRNESFWKGANVLIHRLKKIGIKNLKESLKKRCIGLLVITEMEKGKPFPKYNEIYDMAQKFSGAFASSSYQASPGVPSILNYPMQPAMVSDTFVATAYEQNDPLVSKPMSRFVDKSWFILRVIAFVLILDRFRSPLLRIDPLLYPQTNITMENHHFNWDNSL